MCIFMPFLSINTGTRRMLFSAKYSRQPIQHHRPLSLVFISNRWPLLLYSKTKACLSEYDSNSRRIVCNSEAQVCNHIIVVTHVYKY